MGKRLIWAEDAVKALDALFVKQIKRFGYDSYEKADEKTQLVCDGISESIGCLLDLPSAQPKTHEERTETHACDYQRTETHKWIPVTERLPEDIRPVIVTWCNTDPASYYQHIVGNRFIGVAHYKSGKWYWYSSTTEDFLAEYGRYDGEEFDEAIEVLAWCELPSPCKG